MSMTRTRWSAIGAAVAVTLGAGGIGLVNAAVSPSGAESVFVPIEPCRVVDTRDATQFNVPNQGPYADPIGADEAITIDASGGECVDDADAAIVPDSATGVALNVTAIGPTAATFLTVFASDVAEQPNASNLNPTPGEPPTPNAVTTDLSADGEFDIYNRFGEVDVAVDIVGYYTAADALIDSAKSVVATSDDAATPVAVTTDTPVGVASMKAPGAGTVVASAVGTVLGDATTLACSLSETTAADTTNEQTVTPAAADPVSISLLDTFTVAADDEVAISIICTATGGTGTTVTNPQLVLTYVPATTATT